MSQPGAPSVGGNQYEQIQIDGGSKVQMGNIHNHTNNYVVLCVSSSEILNLCKWINAQPSSPLVINRDVNKLGEHVEKLANTTSNANELEISEIIAAFQKSKGTLRKVEERLLSPSICAKEQKPTSPEISADEIAGISARLQHDAKVLQTFNLALRKPPRWKRDRVAGSGPIQGSLVENASILDDTKGNGKATPLKSPRITSFPDERTALTAFLARKALRSKPDNGVDYDLFSGLMKYSATDLPKKLTSEKKGPVSSVSNNLTKLTGESTGYSRGKFGGAASLNSSGKPRAHQETSTTKSRIGYADFFAQIQDFRAAESSPGSVKLLTVEDVVTPNASKSGLVPDFSRNDSQFSKSAECLLTSDPSELPNLADRAAEKTKSSLSVWRAEHLRNRSVGASPLSTRVSDAASASLSVPQAAPARKIRPKASQIQVKPKPDSDISGIFSSDYPSTLAHQSLSTLESDHENLFPKNLQPLLVRPIRVDDPGILGWKKSARSMMYARQSLLIHYSKRGMLGELGELLRNKPMNVNGGDSSYGNALHSAVAYGQRNAIPLLLNHGADINFQFVGPFTRKSAALPEYCRHAITIAIARKDNDMLKYLILNGANVNVNIPKVDTALKLAVLMGNLEVTQTLIEHRAVIHDDGKELGDALQAAAFFGNIPIIKYLCDNGADVNARSGVLGSALQAASCKQHYAAVCLLLQRGAKFDFPCGTIFGSALHAAAFAGSVAIVKILVEQVQADVHACGGMYGSALHAAARQGHIQIVKALADWGSNIHHDIKLESSTFGTPLQAAALCGADNVVRELLARGADPDALGHHATKSPLVHAIEKNHPRVVFSLVDYGAVLEPKDKESRPLLAASESGRPKICSFLISKGATAVRDDIIAATKAGHVAVARVLLESNSLLAKDSYFLHTAIYMEREDLAELFIKYGADVNSVNKDITPLQRSIQHKSPSLVQFLLSHGADPNGPDGSHTSPLVQAVERLDSKIVQILVTAGADPNKPETR
ncbi:hypothetical protein VE00_07272 [Pseudogymnoascus sp. WSF 3629]|nr:hypothetical protein VE00_07272 [Pseudogymnoascus sp. WSF 3629]